MGELLNKLFESENFSLRSTNYRINRFCNYIVLNLSIHCRYLNEIGIQIIEKQIVLTVNTELFNKILFENECQNFLKNASFTNEFSFLKTEGTVLTTDILTKPFPEKFIKKLSHYYFIPKRTRNKYLFKYCRYDENVITLLINNSLWFSDPASFNDPFDCRYSIDADPLDREIINFYYAKASILTQNISFERFVSDFKMPPKGQFLKDLEEHHFINSFSNQQGVCCFTENHKNTLMWAHYAQNATGLCLVFDTSKDVMDEYYKFSGDKVKYRSSMVRKFYDGSPYFEVTDIIYSKRKIWSYECEVRERKTFEKGQINRAIPFDPQTLVGIILGARMNKSDKETIKSLTSQLNRYNIEYIDSDIDLQNNSIRLKKNLLNLR
ncbi:MAG: DUF2971 domain-containing protein [Bacteroidota bacterium]